jgi:DNA-binding transcriptional LysR family regulator
MQGKQFNEIVTFVEVARRLSFARSAQALGLEASVVSRRVADLEVRLGARLLARSTRRVSLSNAGQLYLQHCEAALAALDDAQSKLSALVTSPEGQLRVAAPTLFGRLYLTRWLPSFLRKYPKLQISLLLGDRYTDLIAERVDVAIRIGRLQDSQLTARRAVRSRRWLVAAPSYLTDAGKPRVPADLAHHACIVFALFPDALAWRLGNGAGTEKVRVSGPLSSDCGDAVLDAVEAGMGIAMIADFLARPRIAHGKLVRVLPLWEGPRADVHLVHTSARTPPHSVQLFMRDFTDHLKGLPDWLD